MSWRSRRYLMTLVIRQLKRRNSLCKNYRRLLLDWKGRSIPCLVSEAGVSRIAQRLFTSKYRVTLLKESQHSFCVIAAASSNLLERGFVFKHLFQGRGGALA